MISLRDFTAARVALGRAGDSIPTQALLDFRLAHARARDTVKAPLDTVSLCSEMTARGWNVTMLRTEAKTREEYLRRPDRGRKLDIESIQKVAEARGQCPPAVVVADGLSSVAVHRHALPVLERIVHDLEPARIWIVQQGRVAVGDHIGELLDAGLSVVILGERPGLSTPDSLGVYLTWKPCLKRTDAERNCVSNIHSLGLSYDEAAHKLRFLINESRRRKLSGVELKESAGRLLG
ncbi:MAG TPA: ethanolamine ammonia-lyase subunit EutC [Bryobacteraceae bacterium]|jgi:ethanolamine ammonia-lyase small subunit|nr:ethanolamine ammonia-lyase subunit EutC [Bryobacteraceae bacterium]